MLWLSVIFIIVPLVNVKAVEYTYQGREVSQPIQGYARPLPRATLQRSLSNSPNENIRVFKEVSAPEQEVFNIVQDGSSYDRPLQTHQNFIMLSEQGPSTSDVPKPEYTVKFIKNTEPAPPPQQIYITNQPENPRPNYVLTQSPSSYVAREPTPEYFVIQKETEPVENIVLNEKKPAADSIVLPKPAIIAPIPKPTYIAKPDFAITPIARPTTTIIGTHLADYQCSDTNEYFGVLNECDSYIECQNNIGYKYECPDGLLFNRRAVYPDYPCAYFWEIQCDASAVLRAPEPTRECPRQYGYFPIQNGDCSNYIICQEGVATVMNCPPGLVYNQVERICDWPEHVPSCRLNGQVVAVVEQNENPVSLPVVHEEVKVELEPKPVNSVVVEKEPTNVDLIVVEPKSDKVKEGVEFNMVPRQPTQVPLNNPVYFVVNNDGVSPLQLVITYEKPGNEEHVIHRPEQERPIARDPVQVPITIPARPNPQPVPVKPNPTFEVIPTPVKPISTPAPAVVIPLEPVPEKPKPTIIAPISRPIYIAKPDLAITPIARPTKAIIGTHLADYQCSDTNGYFGVLNECDSYIECQNNIGYKYECPDGLLFNSRAVYPDYPCAYFWQVECDASAVLRAPQPTRECPRQYGYFPIQNGACSKYIICQEGVATVMNCPPGLVFNQVERICDWPENVPSCSVYSIERPGARVPTQVPITIPVRPNPQPVPVVIPTTIKPIPPPAPAKVIHLEPVPEKPKPAIIAPISRPTYIAKPDLAITPIARPTTTIIGTHLADYQCRDTNGYFGVLNECDSYIECQDNVGYKYECPDGLSFNRRAVYPEYPCAYAWEVECDASAVSRAPQPTRECPRQYGYFPIQNGDCSNYIICQEGVATVMNCPPGLVFNPDERACDWPERVPTCSLTVFTGFTCPSIRYEDDENAITKFRYGDSCNYYVACQRGKPRLLSCDLGFAFDEQSQVCVAADYVKNCRQ